MVTLEVTSGNYVSFAHRLLWVSSQRHLDIAAERPNDDSWMLHLSAGLLAAAAFEAYLNYIGEELLPEVWVEERKFFSAEPYRGTEGNLRRIAEEVQWTLPPKTRKPFAGLLELQSLRDKLVHAKPHKVAYRRVHKEGQWPTLPPTWLYREAPAKRIRLLIADVEAFAVSLHNVVLRSELHGDVFGSHPFLGSLGFGIHNVEAVG
jgi:hypothetical protein